ncbi:hypothetical protein [Paraburkholderia tropica]|uniref:hypothetical protein n=1 Tax=Paraburkholderia tropica TaxID=92647 RepID=UPI002AB613DE|nr:hypothetical protein [Paraburkholderia tropica]
MSNLTVNPSFPPFSQTIDAAGETLVGVQSLGFPAISPTTPLDLTFADASGNVLAVVKAPLGGSLPLNISTSAGLTVVARSTSAFVLVFE